MEAESISYFLTYFPQHPMYYVAPTGKNKQDCFWSDLPLLGICPLLELGYLYNLPVGILQFRFLKKSEDVPEKGSIMVFSTKHRQMVHQSPAYGASPVLPCPCWPSAGQKPWASGPGCSHHFLVVGPTRQSCPAHLTGSVADSNLLGSRDTSGLTLLQLHPVKDPVVIN